MFESVCLYRINGKNELMNSEFKLPIGFGYNIYVFGGGGGQGVSGY